MSARFEAEILYSVAYKTVLETYAESMGWDVAAAGDDYAALYTTGEHTEDDILADVESALAFFNNEAVPPLSWRIVRVIFDSVTGLDEITEVSDGA